MFYHGLSPQVVDIAKMWGWIWLSPCSRPLIYLENAPTLGLYPPLKSLSTFLIGLLIQSPILMKLGLLINKPQFEVVYV